MSEAATETILVQVPEGMAPGSIIDNVVSANGRIFQVVVPPGAEPGHHYYVDIPEGSPGGLLQVNNTEGGKSSMKIMGGAAAAAGLVGAVVMGPLVGLGMAGAAVYATTRQDNVGEAARATGSATATIGGKAMQIASKVGAKAKEVDDKHNFSGRAAEGIKKGAQWFEKKLSGTGSGSGSTPSAPPG